MWLVFVLSWLPHWCRCVHCSMLVQCDVVYMHAPIHYANFQLEVDPHPVPVPAAAEQREEQRQEQRQEHWQEQQEGLEVDVEVEVNWEVPEVPERAAFGDELHLPDKFVKVTSAEATAVDVIDGGGTRIMQPPVPGAGDSAGVRTE